MSSPRQRKFLVRTAAPLALAVLLGGAIVLPAAPADADQKHIDQVAAQVAALENDAANAAELVNAANVRLAQINAKIVVLTKQLKAAQRLVAQVTGTVDALARTAYTSGGTDGMMQAIFADSPDDFLLRAADLEAVARSTNAGLRRTQSARLALAQVQVELAQQQGAATAAAKDAADQRAYIATKLAQAKALLATLKEAERKRLAAIAEARRQASIREARRAAAAAAAAAARQRARDNAHSGGSSRSPGYSGGGSQSARARIAVSAALAHVGDPYSFNANPTSSWDCSKLTAWAWAQAGVYLTPYSFSQYSETARVSRDQLQPGDLLFFFGGGAHHVGMYIGGGRMVHAANPSSGVEISSIDDAWYAQRYSGAGRPG